MGIYDREYYREPDDGRGGGQRSMVTTLILINVAVYIIDAFWVRNGDHPLHVFFALPSDIFNYPWEVWRFLSYGFLHEPLEDGFVWHIAFNMYTLWLFGRDIEGIYGKREFLRIYLVLIVVSGLVWVLCESLAGGGAFAIGASGAVIGVMMLYVLHYPHRKLIVLPIPVPVPVWVVGAFMVFINVMGAIGVGNSRVAYTTHLGGAAFAFLYHRSGIRLSKFLPGGISWKKIRPAPKLRVHHPDDRYADLDRQADRILEKVHRDGAESISAKEKRILEDYSRRMRQKHK